MGFRSPEGFGRVWYGLGVGCLYQAVTGVVAAVTVVPPSDLAGVDWVRVFVSLGMGVGFQYVYMGYRV